MKPTSNDDSNAVRRAVGNGTGSMTIVVQVARQAMTTAELCPCNLRPVFILFGISQHQVVNTSW